MAIVSTKHYEVKFLPRNEDGKGGVCEFIFELDDESPCFQYGNQTMVTMKQYDYGMNGRPSEQTFDTRYDTSLHRDGSNFDWWCRELLKEKFIPTEYVREIKMEDLLCRID